MKKPQIGGGRIVKTNYDPPWDISKESFIIWSHSWGKLSECPTLEIAAARLRQGFKRPFGSGFVSDARVMWADNEKRRWVEVENARSF